MVTKVDAFKTTDGNLFENELDAYKHECQYMEKLFLPKRESYEDHIEYIKKFAQ